MTDLCRILDWDSNFFGCRIARIETDRFNSQSLDRILCWSKEQGIDCLYFLCAPDDDESVALAESANFHLVDVRVELNWKVQETPPPSSAVIREYHKKDLPDLQQIASQVYTGTRFYFDNRFDPNRAAELYTEWIAKSCSDESQKVFVVQAGHGIGGFITCELSDSSPTVKEGLSVSSPTVMEGLSVSSPTVKEGLSVSSPTEKEGLNNEDKALANTRATDTATVGRIGLLAVKDDAQGKGYGQQLVQAAQHYFFSADAAEARVVTQGRNISGQRLYQSRGFRTYKVGLWYHKWF